MSELITIARPYAKAAFDFAVLHQAVVHWQIMLTFCTKISCDKRFSKLLSGIVAPRKLADMFILICGDELDVAGQNLIRVMAENGRLMVLPDVLKQFLVLRSEQEAIVEVDVISANRLKEEQLIKISCAMEQRLSRKVKLNCEIDNSVVAGVIIRVGDMVIDGSVRRRLERLANVLQF